MKYIKQLDIDFNNWDEINDNDIDIYQIYQDYDTNVKYFDKFIQFLIDNNILNHFFINLKNSKWNKNNYYYFKNHNIVDWIDQSFFWGSTSQGNDLWEKINRKWRYYKNEIY